MFINHTRTIHTAIVLIIEPVKNNYFSRNNAKKIDFSIIMGVIKEGVLTEAGSIIRTLTVPEAH